jgi:hypothetical protein
MIKEYAFLIFFFKRCTHIYTKDEFTHISELNSDGVNTARCSRQNNDFSKVSRTPVRATCHRAKSGEDD